jgi:hypothetical protein
MNLRPSAARFTDVYDALERLRVLVERGEHRVIQTSRLPVT